MNVFDGSGFSLFLLLIIFMNINYLTGTLDRKVKEEHDGLQIKIDQLEKEMR